MKPFRKYFRNAIKSHYASDADDILVQTEAHYDLLAADIQFSKNSANPVDRRLDFCAYFLALIKTLEAREASFAEIKKICLEITYAYVTPRNRFQRFLKKLPLLALQSGLAVGLVRKFSQKVAHKDNEAGFVAHIITDKQETYGLGYGIDIVECGICKLFDKHEFGLYTPILCEVDKVTSQLAGLELIRTGTIASGADKCDFRFKILS